MKKILIVGATSAIAQEVAKIYAAQKHSLVLIGRNQVLLETIKNDLIVRGATEVSILMADLNDFPVHEQLIHQAWEKSAGFDVSLIAHGTLGDQITAEKNQAELLNIVNSNFISHASLLNFIGEKKKQQGHGTIAVINSVAGDRGKQSNYIYGAAQAGKATYTDGLRNRLFPAGVHVVNLKLGFVDTPMTKTFKKGPLWASAPSVGKNIVLAIEQKKNTAYLPGFWRLIMLIICSVPEFIFKRLKL